ncbi:DUF5610 domain-containing protein [Oceanimonas baumannii]|uniref:DUF5610 domain-containing protein n=1 Tax=Oceanimonas baumannii TaxID=129578 RepID=UPI003A959A5D
MAISPVSGSQISQSTRNGEQQLPAEQSGPSELAMTRSELKARGNQSIVQAMFDGGKPGSDKAMNILYGEIMSTINAELGEEQAITREKLADKPDDYWSAEKTAGRIVDGALGFFDAFKKQHPTMPEEQQREQFLSTITEAIDKGFGEAIKILDGLSVFNGAIKENALATRDIITEKLNAFREGERV